MTDDKRTISPELARKLIAAVRDPAGARRTSEIVHFGNVQKMVA
jgi:hypothetical protein